MKNRLFGNKMLKLWEQGGFGSVPHGCASQHKVGDKFYFDGSGNLLTKLAPRRIFMSALTAMAPLISSANELFYAGVDSNELRFKRTACHDVGLECGGWGNVAVEIKMEKRKDAK